MMASENRLALSGIMPEASRPDMMHSAGVAELVDALDLGSSDESCGGSSPSARTRRRQRLRMTNCGTTCSERDMDSPNHRRRLCRRAPTRLTLSGHFGRTKREED